MQGPWLQYLAYAMLLVGAVLVVLHFAHVRTVQHELTSGIIILVAGVIVLLTSRRTTQP
jgi:hypothetical protein